MAAGPVGNTRFLAGVDEWVAGLGRLRDVVRQRVLAAQLDEVRTDLDLTRAGVLDVGCGQGTQALRLARAGHDVTGLDISADLLARFSSAMRTEPADVAARVRLVLGPGEAAPDLVPGPFDLILCHGVLPYLDEVGPMLNALSRVAAERATLSVLVRNGSAMAMRDGLQGNWGPAAAAFDSRDYVNRLGLKARAHTQEDINSRLRDNRWRPERWYGVRVFTDHADEEAVPPPEELALLLAAELEAGHRDPYRHVAALLHLVYTRG